MSAAVCVVGATGATGTRVALLAAQAGLPVVLAGRNRAKLDLLSAELGGAEVRTVDLDRPETLDRALDGAAAVASCVGPFTRFGFPVAEAAVRSRVHYVDTNGEPRFCLRLLRELDGPARQAGVALAPAAGGSVAGDFAAAHALGAGDLTGARAVTLAYRIRGMRPSSGTLRSEIEITADGAVIVAGGALVEVPAGGPVRLLPNGPGVRFPIPDPVLVSRYCPLPSIEAYFVAPLPGVVGRVMQAAERVASRPAVRARLRHLAARLPETDDGCPHGVFSIAATVWGPWGARTTTATASDVYGFTARSVVRLAGALSSGHPAPVGDGGVRAPSQIVDDVEKAAVELGIRLEHRVTAPGETGRLRPGTALIMGRALIAYYSFTAQTERAAGELEKTCIEAGWEARTCKLDFAAGAPEFPLRPLIGRAMELSLPSLLERPVPVRFDESVLDEAWDLVLIGSPTWLVSPARPVSSFLQTPAARHLLDGTPFGVFVVCRGFWRPNRARVRALGERAGGRYVGGTGFGFDGHYLQTNKAFFAYHTSAGASADGYGLSETTLAGVRAFGTGLLRELR